MLYQSLGFLVQQPAEAVELLILGIVARLHAVDQVVIEIADAGLLQLLIENSVTILKAVEESAVELCS